MSICMHRCDGLTSLFLFLFQSQLEQAEHCLGPKPSTEGPSALSVTATLLRAQLCYSTGQVTHKHAHFLRLKPFSDLSPTSPFDPFLLVSQVKRGVSYLCEVLTEVGEQRHSKSWYLLRARALQTCSAYLSLDTGTLPEALRQHITDHGEHYGTLTSDMDGLHLTSCFVSCCYRTEAWLSLLLLFRLVCVFYCLVCSRSEEPRRRTL